MRVGYELLDSGRGAEHQVGYHKLLSKKRDWNYCFIKYQTLDKSISNFIFYRFSMIKLSFSIFGQTTGYRIYTLSLPIKLPEIQYPVFAI